MADAVKTVAIQRVSDLLINEAVFLNEVKDEVERLKAELKRMQCFLKDADHMQEKDERFRNRVAEIRDLVEHAENVIDSLAPEVEHQGGFHGVIKRFTSVITKPVHLHKIGMQVKEIRTKLEDISKSLPAYDIPSEGEGPRSTSSKQKQMRRMLRRFVNTSARSRIR